jgi:hypothetical protein
MRLSDETEEHSTMREKNNKGGTKKMRRGARQRLKE